MTFLICFWNKVPMYHSERENATQGQVAVFIVFNFDG